MAWIREPFWPIQEPTGSIPGWFEETAILVRSPGVLVIFSITTEPLATSGTSLENNSLIKLLSLIKDKINS